jgi:hypothetical protein
MKVHYNTQWCADGRTLSFGRASDAQTPVPSATGPHLAANVTTDKKLSLHCLAPRASHQQRVRTMTDNGNTPNKMPAEQWLAIRREEALRIDPETAEVFWKYAETFDPYGVEGVPEELKQLGREYFARSPGSKVGVWFGDSFQQGFSRLRR